MLRSIIMLSVLILSLNVSAQVKFGAKGGYTYNLWTASTGKDYPRNGPPVNNENGSGFHGGVFVQVPFSSKSGLRVEMLYSVRRVYTELDELYDNGYGFTIHTVGFEELALSYLEMPLLLALTPSPRTSVHLGPQFGYLMNGRYDHDITITRSDGYGGTERGVVNSTGGMREMDIAFAVGLEVHVLKGFNMGLRFARSILSLNEKSGGRVMVSRDLIVVHQNMFQVSIGYSFAGK